MLTSRLYDARKLFAAAVMVAFLATLVSAVAIPEAGRRAVETPGSACKAEDLDGKMLTLELGEEPVFTDSSQASCLRGLDRMLDADNFFLVSYSALNLAFFLFLAAIGRARPAILWILVGLLLSLVMLSGDLWENSILRQWIQHSASIPPSPLLLTATSVKWGAIAVASVLLGLIYLLHPRRVAKLIALPAFGSAALLVAGLVAHCSQWINQGSTIGLPLLWLFILLHALIVAIAPRLPDGLQTAGKGDKNV
jgi:hypothetical protein